MSEPSSAHEQTASPAAPPERRPRGLGKKIVTLLVLLTLSFAALEIYVRLTWRSPMHSPKEVSRAPGIFSFRYKINYDADVERADGGTFRLRTNERGFRGPLVSSMAGKPLKVLSLGDSFTAGWGVEVEQHCMWRFMDGYRALHPERDVGHAYVACGGWDPKDYYFGYMTEALEVKPDVVVLGVFSGNDVMPADSPRILDPSKAPFVDAPPDPPQPLFSSFDWVRAELSSNLFIAELRAKHMKPAAYALFDPDMTRQREMWDTSFFYIKAIHDAVRKNGGKLVVLLYPMILQVNTPTALDDAGYDHAAPERVVSAFCKENGIDLITPLDALIEGSRTKKDLYFIEDRHLTVRGHEVTAEVLQRQLTPILDDAWARRTGPPE